MPAGLLAGWAVCDQRGWRGQALVLGLEDLQALPHHQGARGRLHRRGLAPARDQQGAPPACFWLPERGCMIGSLHFAQEQLRKAVRPLPACKVMHSAVNGSASRARCHLLCLSLGLPSCTCKSGNMVEGCALATPEFAGKQQPSASAGGFVRCLGLNKTLYYACRWQLVAGTGR